MIAGVSNIVETTSRPPTAPRRDELRAEELDAYDRVMARQLRDYGLTQPVPYYAALLNSPLTCDHISELGVVYRWLGTRGDSYSNADRAWVDLVLGRQMERGTFYAFMAHAVAYGVRPAAIEAVWRGRDDQLTEDELQLTEYVRQVAAGTVTDAAYAGIARRFGARGAVEYTAFIAHLIMTLTLMKALGSINYVVTEDEVEERLSAILDGSLRPSPPTMPPLAPPHTTAAAV
jgi:hypothetical protein